MSSLDWNSLESQTYQCVRCRKTFSGEECTMRNRICCPECGYRVIKKVRTPLVKRVSAE